MNLSIMSRAELELVAAACRELELREQATALEARFIDFLEGAWPEIDPAPFVPGWHFDALAEHLEAVAKGQIKKLLINEPPRHGKSLTVSVAFPAWVWTQLRYANELQVDAQGQPLEGYQYDYPIMGPQASFMCLSYSGSLAFDHALLMKRLVLSPWYQARWGRRFQIRDDKTATSKFDTTEGGTRISDSFGGTVTGRGADYRLFDDPHKVTEAESEKIREQVLNTYEQALKNRVTDPRTSVEITIMQRTHERDLSGHILAEDAGYVHLMLPAEFEPDRHCITYVDGQPFWADPRRIKGEPLWPEVWGPDKLAPFKKNEYTWAGQYQQRPAPAGGGVIKRDWWCLWGDADDPELAKPENGRFRKHPVYTMRIATLDTAYTEKQKNDPSCMHVWGVFNDTRNFPAAMLAHRWNERLEFPDLLTRVVTTARKFKIDVLLVEDKTAGPPLVQELQRKYADEAWGVELIPINRSSGDKMVRLQSVSHLFKAAMVWAPNKQWAEDAITAITMFPKAQHDEDVDCCSMALRWLRTRGLLDTEDEIRTRERDERKRPERLKPLYPGTI